MKNPTICSPTLVLEEVGHSKHEHKPTPTTQELGCRALSAQHSSASADLPSRRRTTLAKQEHSPHWGTRGVCWGSGQVHLRILQQLRVASQPWPRMAQTTSVCGVGVQKSSRSAWNGKRIAAFAVLYVRSCVCIRRAQSPPPHRRHRMGRRTGRTIPPKRPPDGAWRSLTQTRLGL